MVSEFLMIKCGNWNYLHDKRKKSPNIVTFYCKI